MIYFLVVLINVILFIQGCSQTKLIRNLKDQSTPNNKECCPDTLATSALISRFKNDDLVNDGGNNSKNQNQPTKNDDDTIAIVHISEPELYPKLDSLKTTIMDTVHDDSLQDQAFDYDNYDLFEDEPMGATICAFMVNSTPYMVFDSKHSIYTLDNKPNLDTIIPIDPSSTIGAIIPAFTIGELTSNAYSFAFDPILAITTNNIDHASITSLLEQGYESCESRSANSGSDPAHHFALNTIASYGNLQTPILSFYTLVGSGVRGDIKGTKITTYYIPGAFFQTDWPDYRERYIHFDCAMIDMISEINPKYNKDIIAVKDGRKLFNGKLTKNIHETLFEAILFIDKLKKQLEGWNFERILSKTLTRYNIHGALNWRHGYIL